MRGRERERERERERGTITRHATCSFARGCLVITYSITTNLSIAFVVHNFKPAY